MARFFRTSRPNFVQGNIYTPPVSLMRNVLAVQDKGINDTLASTDIFKNLNINHISTDEEKDNVDAIKQYYNDKANQITSDIIKNPLDWKNKVSDINSLKRELTQDFATGNISKIQGSYNNMRSWLKDHEDVRKSDPFLFNRAYQHAMENWGGNSYKTPWEAETLLKSPDFQSLYKNSVKELIPNRQNIVNQTPDGKYMVRTEKGIETLSPDRIIDHAYNKLISDPKNLEWMKQQQRLGMGNYFNEDGSLNALKKDGTINENSSLAPVLNSLRDEGYSKKTNSVKFTPNTVALNDEKMSMSRAKLSQSKEEFDQHMSYIRDKDAKNQLEDINDIINDPSASDESREYALQQRERINGYDLNVPNPTLSQNYFNMKNNPSVPQQRVMDLTGEIVDDLKDYASSRKEIQNYSDKDIDVIKNALLTSDTPDQVRGKLEEAFTKNIVQKIPRPINNDLFNLGTNFIYGNQSMMDSPEYITAKNKVEDTVGMLFGNSSHNPFNSRAWKQLVGSQARWLGGDNSIYGKTATKWNTARVNRQFEGFSPSVAKNLASIMKSGDKYKQFNYIDKNTGKSIDIDPQKISMVAATTSGNKGNLLKLRDGRQVIAIPKFTPGRPTTEFQQVINNAASNDLPSDSRIKFDIDNHSLNELKSDFDSVVEKGRPVVTMPVNKYYGDKVFRVRSKGNVLNLNTNNLQIRKEVDAAGNGDSHYYLVDKNGNKLHNVPFDSLEALHLSIEKALKNGGRR